MITLARRIDPDITESIFEPVTIRLGDEEIRIENIKTLIKYFIEISHSAMRHYYSADRGYEISITSKIIGNSIFLMDTLRAKLISELIERGYLRYMREIPIGLIKEEFESDRGEEHELSIE